MTVDRASVARRIRVVRPFVNRVLNPVIRPIVRWLPGYALVVHRGRRSGRVYRTPMLPFRRDDEVVFVLTYGPDVDWVRNVLSAGECLLVAGGRRSLLVEPRVVRDRARRFVPGVVRLALRLLRVEDFLVLRSSEHDAPAAAADGAARH